MNPPATQLQIRVTWLGLLNLLGALVATGYLLYLFYLSAGPLYAGLALVLSAIVFRFGASPLFAIAASVLYFHFDIGGLWLPLGSYALAIAAFHHDLKRYRAEHEGKQT